MTRIVVNTDGKEGKLRTKPDGDLKLSKAYDPLGAKGLIDVVFI